MRKISVFGDNRCHLRLDFGIFANGGCYVGEAKAW